MCLLCLSGCGQRDGLAPVVELNWRGATHNAKTHVVRRGDTLYAIAFANDQDYRQLASYNQLRYPYTLRVGQVVRLQPGNAQLVPRRTRAAASRASERNYTRAPSRASSLASFAAVGRWYWPAKGRVATTFLPKQGRKGIDIAGARGEKIHAAATGVIAYAGNGLPGYGNLIIIKHNNQFLTAYGNNSRNLVHEGQAVKAGQAIAEIGVVDRRFWGVHFEIRRHGVPVNPLNYLQKG